MGHCQSAMMAAQVWHATERGAAGFGSTSVSSWPKCEDGPSVTCVTRSRQKCVMDRVRADGFGSTGVSSSSQVTARLDATKRGEDYGREKRRVWFVFSKWLGFCGVYSNGLLFVRLRVAFHLICVKMGGGVGNVGPGWPTVRTTTTRRHAGWIYLIVAVKVFLGCRWSLPQFALLRTALAAKPIFLTPIFFN